MAAFDFSKLQIHSTVKAGGRTRQQRAGKVVARESFLQVPFIREAAGEKETNAQAALVAAWEKSDDNKFKVLELLTTEHKLSAKEILNVLGIQINEESKKAINQAIAQIKTFKRMMIVKDAIGDAIPETLPVKFVDDDGNDEEREIAGKVLKAVTVGLFDRNNIPQHLKEPDPANLKADGTPTWKEVVGEDGNKIICHPVNINVARGRVLTTSLEEILSKSTEEISRMQEQVRRQFSDMFPVRERLQTGADAMAKIGGHLSSLNAKQK